MPIVKRAYTIHFGMKFLLHYTNKQHYIIMITRSYFLKTTALLGVGAFVSPSLLWANRELKKLNSIGLGLFSIPKLLEDDFEGTIKSLADMGITELETLDLIHFQTNEIKTLGQL